MALNLEINLKGSEAIKALEAELKALRAELAAHVDTSGKVAGARKGETEAVVKQGKEISAINRIRMEERQEGRLQNFVMNQAREVYGAAALALTTFGLASANSSAGQKKMSESVNQGFLAFQGLDFAMRGVPYGALIAGAMGAIVAIKGMVTVTDEEIKKMQELSLAVVELEYKLGLISAETYQSKLQEATGKAREEYNKRIEDAKKYALELELIKKRETSDWEMAASMGSEDAAAMAMATQINQFRVESAIKGTNTEILEKRKLYLEAYAKEIAGVKASVEKEVEYRNIGASRELAINMAKAKNSEESAKLQLAFNKSINDQINAELDKHFDKSKLTADEIVVYEKEKYKESALKLKESNNGVAAAKVTAETSANEVLKSLRNQRKTEEMDYNKSIEMLSATTAGHKAEVERKYTVLKLEEDEKRYKSDEKNSAAAKKLYSENIKEQIKQTNDLFDANEQLRESKGFGTLADSLIEIRTKIDNILQTYSEFTSLSLSQFRINIDTGQIDKASGTYEDLLRHLSDEIPILQAINALKPTDTENAAQLKYSLDTVNSLNSALEIYKAIDSVNLSLEFRERRVEIALASGNQERIRASQSDMESAITTKNTLTTLLDTYSVYQKSAAINGLLTTLHGDNLYTEQQKTETLKEQLSLYRAALETKLKSANPVEREAAKKEIAVIDTRQTDLERKAAEEKNSMLKTLSLEAAGDYDAIARKKIQDEHNLEEKKYNDLFALGKISKEELESAKLAIAQKYANMEIDINRQKDLAICSATADGLTLVTQTIMELSSQAAQGRIDGLETEKEARLSELDAEKEAMLSVFDVQLENQNLTGAQRKRLEKEREAAEKQANATRKNEEKKYNDEIKGAKEEAWKNERNAKLIMAGIDMAHAIVVALTGGPPPFNLTLAAITAAAALAQVAIIASAPVPKFHTGGVVGSSPLQANERLIVANVGETIRTPKQEAELSRSYVGSNTYHINFNSVVSDVELVTNAIKKVLLDTGKPIDQVFVSQNRNIQLG